MSAPAGRDAPTGVSHFQCAFFSVSISDSAVAHIKEFLRFAFSLGVRIYVGSMVLEVNDVQRAAIEKENERLKATGITLSPTSAPAVLQELGEDLLSWDAELLKDLIRKNEGDLSSAEEFKKNFEATFELTDNGTLKATKDQIRMGQLIYIRHRNHIRLYTGMQLGIATLCLEYSGEKKRRMHQIHKNKCAMFGLFVAAYGAYFQACKNMGWKNKFDRTALNMNGMEIEGVDQE